MKIFFIGIKGSGMSSLASILHDLGHEIVGSDVEKHFFTEKNLKKRNIPIMQFGQYDLTGVGEVVLGNSFDESNIDYINATNANIKIIKYYEKLNELIQKNTSIAVSGANGKTTTTGLLVSSMKNIDTSYLIGDGTGIGNKKSNKFIFEACEYKNTFLNYTPKMAIINNIEFDHPDFFKNIDSMINSFQEFANNVDTLVINGDDLNCQKIKHSNKYTFGLKEGNALYAQNIEYKKEGISFDLIYNNEQLGKKSLPFFGEYMLYNCLGVILINLLLENDIDLTLQNIANFSGVSRRFSETVLDEKKQVFLIDDYAHHPTAIKETLKAIRQKYPTSKVLSVFQPHTYSRVEAFAYDFAYELLKSDVIVIDDVFKAARETSIKSSENTILQEINKIDPTKKILTINDLNNKFTNTVICLFGAGDIDLKYKEQLIKLYK